MRLSLPLLSGVAFFIPAVLAAATPTTTTPTALELLKKSGLKFDGDSEFDDETYKNLAALRKLFEGNSPKSTKTTVLTNSKSKGNRRLTNGQRLAMGLPPNPPARRGTRVRRQEPSPFARLSLAVSEVGLLSGTDDSGLDVGFVSATLASSGQLTATADVVEALQLSVTYNPNNLNPQHLRVEATSAPEDSMSILSLINGRDNESPNVGPGSWHYLYVGMSEFPGTEPLATPQVEANSFTSHTGLSSAIETDVWNLDVTTGLLTATWINEDGTAVPVSLYTQAGVLLALADPEAFQKKYPAPITPFITNIIGKPTSRK